MPSIISHNLYSMHHVRLKKPLEDLIDRFPVIISHIDCEFCIVDVEPVIFVPDEAPMEAVLGGIALEGVELVFDLWIDVLVLALRFAALGLDHPDRSVFLHDDVVCVEQPLVAQSVQINDGEILLAGIAVLIDPVDIVPALAILLE